LLLSACDFFAVGSYPFAEYYTFHKYSKESLIKRINIFKDNHPEYKLLKTFDDGREEEVADSYDENGNMYMVYFYFRDLDLSIHCVIKEGQENPVRLGFTACSSGRNFGDWKRVNKDLEKEENIALKQKFETEILNDIGGWSRK